MAEDLSPLPLDDVLAIVERRRLRRHRLALRTALGAGAVVVAGAGIRAASAPDGTAAATTSLPVTDPTTTTATTEATGDAEWQQAAVERFYDLGFTYADAERLAALWGTDVYVPKITGGLAPGSDVLREGDDAAALAWFQSLVDAYAAGGGTLEQAEQLAEAWGYDVVDAKAVAGARAVAEGG